MNARASWAPGALLPRIETGVAQNRAPRTAGARACALPAGADASDPIDAVVTWVDGEDPAHRAKFRAYLAGLEAVPEIASADRYRESGEFAFCIASLLRFAPWLRRIHLVTDAQEPAFMPALRASGRADKVVIVDHATLFGGHERHLPTFNNRTLLSALWRIPGLAQRFVYLNDDFALLRPIAAEDFFRGERPVLRGRWCLQPWHRDLAVLARAGAAGCGLTKRAPAARPGYHQGQALAARRAGFRWRYFRTPHAPHPLLRSLFAEHFARHPEQFEENIRHRLRSVEQFLADALANHLALRQGSADIDNRLRTLRLKLSHYAAPQLERTLASAERDERVAFACLQSLEELSPARRAVLFGWLERRIGNPAEIFRGAGVPVAQ
jgi:hypothetical protein